MTALTGPRFPWGTLLINVLGSFVIGLVAAVTLAPARVAMHPDLRVFLMVGVCGGFTTFSAFSLQTLELMQAGDVAPAAGYIVGSVVFCLAAVWPAGCSAGCRLCFQFALRDGITGRPFLTGASLIFLCIEAYAGG